MYVLQDKRKRAFTQICLSWLAHCARGRVRPERFVVRAAIVVTRHTKSAGSPKDKNGSGNPSRHPGRLGAKPSMSRTEQFRRIKWRKIGPEPVVLTLQRGPGGVHNKGRKANKYKKRLHPPT